MHKVCSVWVPHLLSPQNKVDRVKCAKNIKRTLAATANVDNVYMVIDETWVNLDPHLTKAENKAWLKKNQPRLRVCRQQMTNRKTLLMVAFTPCGRFSITALPHGSTITAQVFKDFLHHTGEKWRCLRSNPIHLCDVILQMDNARPHVSALVTDFLAKRHVTILSQSAYSPDPNLCDRFLFAWLKADLRKMHFDSSADVETAALRCLNSMSKTGLPDEVTKLIEHCNAVIKTGGDYITHS